MYPRTTSRKSGTSWTNSVGWIEFRGRGFRVSGVAVRDHKVLADRPRTPGFSWLRAKWNESESRQAESESHGVWLPIFNPRGFPRSLFPFSNWPGDLLAQRFLANGTLYLLPLPLGSDFYSRGFLTRLFLPSFPIPFSCFYLPFPGSFVPVSWTVIQLPSSFYHPWDPIPRSFSYSFEWKGRRKKRIWKEKK